MAWAFFLATAQWSRLLSICVVTVAILGRNLRAASFTLLVMGNFINMCQIFLALKSAMVLSSVCARPVGFSSQCRS